MTYKIRISIYTYIHLQRKLLNVSLLKAVLNCKTLKYKLMAETCSWLIPQLTC